MKTTMMIEGDYEELEISPSEENELQIQKEGDKDPDNESS